MGWAGGPFRRAGGEPYPWCGERRLTAPGTPVCAGTTDREQAANRINRGTGDSWLATGSLVGGHSPPYGRTAVVSGGRPNRYRPGEQMHRQTRVPVHASPVHFREYPPCRLQAVGGPAGFPHWPHFDS